MAHMTKRLLAAGLKELLMKKTLDKITVKELVQYCGVNRQTFYYNFQDIYELLEWIFTEDGNRLLRETEKMACRQDRILAIFQELGREENRKLVINAVDALTPTQLDLFLKRYFRPIIEQIVYEDVEGMPLKEEDRDFLVRLCLVLCVDLLMRWINNGMEGDMSEDLARLVKVQSGLVRDMARRFLDE